MPFRSQAQWKWAFATNQDFARKWARETPGGKRRFARLSKKIGMKAAVDEYMTTLKEREFVRDNSGKFASKPGGGLDKAAAAQRAVDKLAKPKKGGGGGSAKPKKTEAQRNAERATEARDNAMGVLDKVGFDASDYELLSDRGAQDANDPSVQRLIEKGLMERVGDKVYTSALGKKITAAAERGDADGAQETLDRDAVKRGEREAKRQEREAKRAEAEAKRQAAEEEKKKKPKGGGGGGGGKKPADEQRKPDTTAQRKRFDAAIARLSQRLERESDGTRAAALQAQIDKLTTQRDKLGKTTKADGHTPPQGVRDAAKRGLELRSQFGRGGTPVGIARARDLSNGTRVSDSTIKRMVSFFARHAVDKRPGWGDPANPTNGYIAHLLWGGDAGKAWASKIARQLDAETVKANEPTNPELWKRAIAAAKRRYSVYPSRYANAFASTWYRSRGGKWRTVKELTYKHGKHDQSTHGRKGSRGGGGGGGAGVQAIGEIDTLTQELLDDLQTGRDSSVQRDRVEAHQAEVARKVSNLSDEDQLDMLSTIDQNQSITSASQIEAVTNLSMYGATPEIRAQAGDMLRKVPPDAYQQMYPYKVKDWGGERDSVFRQEYKNPRDFYEANSIDFMVATNPQGFADSMWKIHTDGKVNMHPVALAGMADLMTFVGPNAEVGTPVKSFYPTGVKAPKANPQAIAIMQDHYAKTQDALRASGIKEVTLHRGGALMPGMTVEPWTDKVSQASYWASRGETLNGVYQMRSNTIPARFVLNWYRNPNETDQYGDNRRYSQSEAEWTIAGLGYMASPQYANEKVNRRSNKALGEPDAVRPEVESAEMDTVNPVAWFDYLKKYRIYGKGKGKSKRTVKESSDGFMVYKSSDGYRWVAISSTAYLDRDKEIVSTKALKQAVERAEATGEYGPLRFWHVPGIDIGTTDYQALSNDGKFLVESGVITDEAIAQSLMKRGKGWQVSIGFEHPRLEPVGGVFENIRIFERSITPPGRAANPMTGFSMVEDGA
jgi:hypothetical protein